MSSGGLQLLLEIFNSAILEPKEQESWTVVSVKNTSASHNVCKGFFLQFSLFSFTQLCHQLDSYRYHVSSLLSLQWLLDCLACLLKLICQFAVDPADLDLAYHDVFAWSGLTDAQRKRAWPGKSRKTAGDHVKGLHIPRLTEV